MYLSTRNALSNTYFKNLIKIALWLFNYAVYGEIYVQPFVVPQRAAQNLINVCQWHVPQVTQGNVG